MTNPNDFLIDSFIEKNIGMDDSFLSERLSNGLQENIKKLQTDNLLFDAGIGNAMTKDNQQQMRGDKIYWMDKANHNRFEDEFLHQIESFIHRLNDTCYTGINSYEFHYALYQVGTGYKRHKDQFKNDSNRKYSLINYLNTDWLEADGGELVVYQNNIGQKIAPKSRTAVFFESETIEHEVLPSYKARMSITGWLKRN